MSLTSVSRQLLQEGIIINRTHETVPRFLPPYGIQKKRVHQVIKALDAAPHKNAESTRKKNTHQEKKSAPPRRKEAHAHA